MSDPLFLRMWTLAVREIGRAPRDGLAHPFGLDDRTGYWWYVSDDVFRALGAEQTAARPVMFGIPIDIDPDLPADTVRLGLSPEWEPLVELDLRP